jgi:LysR family transcriptional regulator, transcriptional activator of nhaA
MLNYNHLNYFHVAATEGTLAAAAERLGVTQSTVSEQIRALERSLQVILFERTPSGLRLTEAGRLAFEHTSVMFRAGERLVETLGSTQGDLPRTLRVGIGSAVARTTTSDFIMPLLAIERCMPSIRSADSIELLRELRNNELDLVLSETEPAEAARKGINVTLLDRISLVAVASPTVEPAADWHNVGLIHYRASSAYRWAVETFLETHHLRPRIVAEADDALFMLEAAARGGYFVIISRSIARDAVHAGRLKIFGEIENAQLGVHAIFQDGEAAELARRAVDVLIAHVRASHTV